MSKEKIEAHFLPLYPASSSTREDKRWLTTDCRFPNDISELQNVLADRFNHFKRFDCFKRFQGNPASLKRTIGTFYKITAN